MVNRYATSDDILICYAPIIKTPQSRSQIIKNSNIKFINAPKIDSPTQFTLLPKYLKILKQQLRECDMSIIHIHVSLINYICVIAARKINIPYITVIVGCAWDALWNHSIKGKLMAPICYMLEKWAQKNSKYSIYVTENFLQKRYPTNGKYIGCSNVELDFREKPKSKILKSSNEIINIATVAAVNVKYKGQQYVLKALSKLRDTNKNYKYHLVGDGDSSYLKKLTEELNISDMVEFHGAMPHDQISNFLDSIDIYIQPSKQEGLPRSVIEAMSRGCLCMGSNIAGIPELIDSKYLFKAGDYHEIARIIENISNEDIINQGKLNVEKSKDYSKNILDKKRNLFIHNFITESLL